MLDTEILLQQQEEQLASMRQTTIEVFAALEINEDQFLQMLKTTKIKGSPPREGYRRTVSGTDRNLQPIIQSHWIQVR